MSETPTEVLMEAYQRLQAGERRAARKLIKRLLKTHPNSERAWLLLSMAVTEPAQQRECLERVLRLNPHNKEAAQRLAQWDAKPSKATKASVTQRLASADMPNWLFAPTTPGFEPEPPASSPVSHPPRSDDRTEPLSASVLADTAELVPGDEATEFTEPPSSVEEAPLEKEAAREDVIASAEKATVAELASSPEAGPPPAREPEVATVDAYATAPLRDEELSAPPEIELISMSEPVAEGAGEPLLPTEPDEEAGLIVSAPGARSEVSEAEVPEAAAPAGEEVFVQSEEPAPQLTEAASPEEPPKEAEPPTKPVRRDGWQSRHRRSPRLTVRPAPRPASEASTVPPASAPVEAAAQPSPPPPPKEAPPPPRINHGLVTGPLLYQPRPAPATPAVEARPEPTPFAATESAAPPPDLDDQAPRWLLPVALVIWCVIVFVVSMVIFSFLLAT